MSASTSSPAPLLRSRVAGSWCSGEAEVAQHNPARPAEIVARTSQADGALARRAVAAAREAASSWALRRPGERADLLDAVARLLDARADAVATDLAREEGKTRPEALAEVRRAAEILRYFAAQAAFEPDGQTYPSRRDRELLYARRVPVGVIAAVTPWNFPLAIPVWKIAPALAYGNTVVWKPAELVPMTSTHLMQAFVDAGVPGSVLHMVLAPGDVAGDALVGNPDVDGVTFTGSSPVGRRVTGRAAHAGQRVQAELGGVNAAIVLRDADVPAAAEMVARGAFLSAGQKCTATSRIIVDERLMDEFAEHLVAVTDRLVVGDPLAPGVDIGPLASMQRAEAVAAEVEAAERDGRRLTVRRHDDVPDGAFVAPTVFVDLPHGHRLLEEETFGPVATVVPCAWIDHAIALANESRYGLTAAVFTASSAAAMRCIDELQVGMVKVNQETPGNDVHVPFGGMRDSAYGAGEQGKAAREFFTAWKTVYFRGA